jgi:DNA-binding PadR family transcriptional regulator
MSLTYKQLLALLYCAENSGQIYAEGADTNMNTIKSLCKKNLIQDTGYAWGPGPRMRSYVITKEGKAALLSNLYNPNQHIVTFCNTM